ncbi:hypothetical protein CIK81_16510 [Brachybacterium sp. JB7]|uniref:hypothetical protein n=1 Tax=Brachybacterium TaxID=43668 RepID=UPI000BB6EFD8|nr:MULTISPECIES: hypothetical protein [Brachybacterium]PCC34355.1 hypothetical protein CIK71_06135 [Brachybacterium alimentarium]RCS60588.1 hypothetical protein CIK81_16510 [Brachybacterium sp. JB7]RCS66005.1 hypothetical protein CIK73_12750 [Brachybacterium alimentarium]RCS67422.1 hypothetical protein CIK68_15410 [Brachybacterium alimentarium]RCS76354.1 hypothetical protein CIK70_15965 [Brachybacterium alimentarium]
MSLTSLPRRPLPVRLVGALFAVTLLAAGCSAGSDPAAEDSSAASGESATSDDGGDGESDGTVVADTSDGGGQTAASMPVEPIAVTPAPDGFEPPAACSGEGAYFAEVGESSTPDLPERDGETLTIEATGISGENAQLTASLGGGEARPLEDITLGETAAIEQWTISVTSVCEKTDQVEFDLIN